MKKQALVLFFCLAAVFPLWCAENEELTRALKKEIEKRDKADLAVVTSLLEKGANPNGFFDTRDIETFLMEALFRRNNQIARLLLEHGADPQIVNRKGENAAFYGNSEGIALLASRGVRFDITDNDGTSPLMSHNPTNDQKRTIFLLEWEQEHSPNFSAKFESRKEYLTEVLERFLKSTFEERDDSANYALAERLIDAGADPAAHNAKGIPVASFAVRQNKSKLLLIPLLIERGAPLDAFNNSDGETVLWCAASTQSDDLIDFLLSKGVDPNMQNNGRYYVGETPLIAARNLRTINTLLKAGANPNLQEKDGETILMKIGRSNRDFIEPLLSAGADPTIKDKQGKTVLHRWILRGLLKDEALLDDLLARGCLINEPDNDEGSTPLMYAVRYGYLSVFIYNDIHAAIPVLLKKGADPNFRGGYRGRTAFHVYLDEVEKIDSPNFEEVESITESFLASGARPADTDNEGDSALRTVMRLSQKHSKMKPLLSMVLKYANEEEIKLAAEEEALASAAAKEKRAKERSAKISYNILPSLTALGVPLLIGGLSIGMREGVYANDPYKNWMGGVNGFFTLAGSGFFLGALIGVGGGDDGFGKLFIGAFGGLLGFVGGTILACLPAVRSAFNRTSAFYYLPTAISTIAATVVIFNIWRY
jgi:ankyrin repeat protein